MLLVCEAHSGDPAVGQTGTFWIQFRHFALQALAAVLEEGAAPNSAASLREPPCLVRPQGAVVDPRGRERRESFFQKVAGPERLVMVSWTTGAPADPSEKGSRTAIALNLALSIRKNAPQLERRFAYISMDTVAHQVMQEHGFNSALCEAGPCRSTDLKDDIWKMRWYLMLTLTSFDLHVLVIDADIVFLGDPLNEFSRDVDMEVMTDHFFPEKHLWEPWVRDHINTGFILVKPTLPIRFLIADFLDENWQSEQGEALSNHHFRPTCAQDQRVFNHFIVRRMLADIPLVVGHYGQKTFGRQQSIVPAWPWRQVSIRILDPKRIAHGMNFFWRRAHLLDPKVGSLPPEYFLRDRQVWFLDDWLDRFNDTSRRFMTYVHPAGQNLRGDFTTLAAAIEAARLMGRRLVLPHTMNCLILSKFWLLDFLPLSPVAMLGRSMEKPQQTCRVAGRNTPAYSVWNLDVTIQREADSGNCTFDYFSWAKNLLDAHAGFVIESGVRHLPEFRQLVEDSGSTLPAVADWPRLSLWTAMAAEWSEWSLKTCVVLCFLNAAALLALGAFPVPWVLLLLGGSLLLQADRALAHLSCWAIARTPKAFHWSIELICRGAIKVKLVCVEGVRFNTQRNEEALLNLWAALHLDDATNEAAIVHGAHHVGGLDAPHMVKPLEHGAKALQADAAQRNFQGVYLGELVWVLIAQLLPKVLESSPQNLMKTALFAVGFGAWDATVIMGAKAFELALDAKYCLGNVLPCLPSTEPRPTLDRCFVHVHLICGRGLVRSSALAQRPPPAHWLGYDASIARLDMPCRQNVMVCLARLLCR
eukprot:g15541.t1